MNQSSRREMALLRQLARLYGVQTAYLDMEKKRVPSSQEGMLAALKSLGAPVEGMSDLAGALRQQELALWDWCLPPVAVAWDGTAPSVELHLPASESSTAECELRLETGETAHARVNLEDLPIEARHEIDGKQYASRRLDFAAIGLGPVPLGYHDFALRIAGHSLECLVISAPKRFYSGPRLPTLDSPPQARHFGTFLPVYALHSKRSWGTGDLTDLEGLVDLTARAGGDFVGTLPILASFLDQPFEPSPYSPVSRLFWNELYADPARPLPGFDSLRQKRPAEVESLNAEALVPYKQAMAVKRGALERQSRAYLQTTTGRAELERYLGRKPAVRDYAQFRAALEKLGTYWGHWPEAARRGELGPTDYDARTAEYFAFAQWRVDTHLRELAASSKQKGVSLYLDMPIGVNSAGYDAWRHQELFAQGMSVGAPPDFVTTSGQDWGFAPMSPHALRKSRYAYVRDYLHTHLEVAGILRLDHVMGLYRLYWVPAGAGARNGIYVRYPLEELAAVHSLESHRHKAQIIGEDLGIVPDVLKRGLNGHAIGRMYVLMVEMATGSFARGIPRRVVASFGTHDLPPFAAYWQDADAEERKRLGVLDDERAAWEAADRKGQRAELVAYMQEQGLLAPGDESSMEKVLLAILALLGRSPAELEVVNLEDLWLETLPQNVPGTSDDQHPNWRRRARYSIEEMMTLPQVTEALRIVREARQASA